MKYVLLICASLGFSLFSYAQSIKVKPISDTLKVNMTKDSMSVVYKNQRVPVSDIKALDSLMKSIPHLKNLEVELDCMNVDTEKSRAVKAVLDQCQCNITAKSRTFR
ncbi:MAG: hypothetical protein ABIR18_08830 [Chitinophagaceae bacterium]